MGNNGHAGEGLRLTREWIQAGAIGPVREIHCWSDRPGKWRSRITKGPPRPRPSRPRSTGTFGSAPRRCGPTPAVSPPQLAGRGSISAPGRSATWPSTTWTRRFTPLTSAAPRPWRPRRASLKPESYPLWPILTYEFAAKGDRPAVTLIWYDGGKMPPRPSDLDRKHRARRQRHLLRRRQGDAALRRLVGPADAVPGKPAQEFHDPRTTIPRSIGHRAEWIKACKEHKPEDAKAGFAYSGPFTEALLVGTWPCGCRSGSSGTRHKPAGDQRPGGGANHPRTAPGRVWD